MPTLHRSLRISFTAQAMLPYRYPDPQTDITRSFGGALEPRYIVGAEALDQ